MNVSLWQRMTAASLTALILLTTTGVSLDRHFCQGILKDIAWFSKAETCHEQTAPPPCPMHASMAADEEEDCCSHESDFLKLETELSSLPALYLPSAPKIAYLPAFPALEMPEDIRRRDVPDYLFFKPPLPVRDIPVLHQSFLL